MSTPNIDAGAKLQFQESFYKLAQQRNTKLGSSSAVFYLPADGKTNNMARIGSTELVEVNLRNPDKQYIDYDLDNRKMTKRRFTRTFQVDKLYDINNLLADPTSPLMENLLNAANRVTDRVIVSASVGDVLVGGPEETGTLVSAANDGVITVAATSGLTYATIQSITQNFINNDLEYEDFMGTVLAISGKENTALMGQTNFISNDFITSRPVEEGVMRNVGTYGIVMFAGSVDGGITKVNPILPEASGVRKCVALAPRSIAMSKKVDLLEVKESATKVNSWDVTIDLWINAMRIEGKRVQIFTTTI